LARITTVVCKNKDNAELNECMYRHE